MKIRNLLIAFVLAMMVVCVGNTRFTAASAAPPSCALNCFNNYNYCASSCGGDPICLAECKEERDCCMVICHGGNCLTKPLALPPAK